MILNYLIFTFFNLSGILEKETCLITESKKASPELIDEI